MDVYRALNADVPHLLFTVLHQAGPTVSNEDFTRTVTALHLEIRRQAQEVGEALQQWLQQQARQEAEETARKLQRQGLLAETASVEAAQQVVERDFRRFASRVGSESLLGMQGSGEEVFSETMPLDADLARRVADGHEYMASLGFKPGQARTSKMSRALLSAPITSSTSLARAWPPISAATHRPRKSPLPSVRAPSTTATSGATLLLLWSRLASRPTWHMHRSGSASWDWARAKSSCCACASRRAKRLCAK